MNLRVIAGDAIGQATGRAHRDDEVLPRSGGPAGNARLTAWTGLLLLLLFGAELITLLDVRGLLSWHIAVGVLLVPPALVKTASTGWRIIRYYTGNAPYRRAGPPPLALRVLGPLVVGATLAVLASGLWLIVLGATASRRGMTVFGQPIDAVTVHKATFVVWAVVTGLHILGRLVPALQLTLSRAATMNRLPGRTRRGMVLGATVLVAIAATALTLTLANVSGWDRPSRGERPPAAGRP